MTEADAIARLAAELVGGLRERGLSVATAESCTGGWIAKSLTDVAGSSACFGYGVVSYSNDAKESLLGVRPSTLEACGAVSEATVREMAAGVLELSRADVSVAVSGIAGPTGGSAGKPVGTVWFAWSLAGDGAPHTDAECRQFDGDRAAVRARSVIGALSGLLERI